MTSNDGSIINFGVIGWPFPYESSPSMIGRLTRITLPETKQRARWVEYTRWLARRKASSLALQGHRFMTCTSSAPEMPTEKFGGMRWGRRTPKKSGERECGTIFFLSLFETNFCFWNRYGIERGRNHQASKPWVSNHPKMSFRCPYQVSGAVHPVSQILSIYPSLKLTSQMEIPIFPGLYHQNGGFFMVMLVYMSVPIRSYQFFWVHLS